MTSFATVDSKGRILIPKRDREELGVKPGDALFIEREDNVLHLIPAENPFDALARETIAEYEASKTRRLQRKRRD